MSSDSKSENSKEFLEAAERVKTLKTAPSNDVKLELYALYKQATVGDVQGTQPYRINLEARAKWDAWNKVKGKKKADAETAYIALVDKLVAADTEQKK